MIWYFVILNAVFTWQMHLSSVRCNDNKICHDGIERKTEMLRQNFPTMCKIMYRIKHLNITKILSSSTNHNFRNFWQHMFCLTSSHLSLQHSIKITSNEVWKPQRNNWDSTTHGRYDDEPPPQKCCNLDLCPLTLNTFQQCSFTYEYLCHCLLQSLHWAKR